MKLIKYDSILQARIGIFLSVWLETYKENRIIIPRRLIFECYYLCGILIYKKLKEIES